MTYKLKDYLLEDKEYVGTQLSSGEKGVLVFFVPELFVPIRPGNMGTHNALFKTSLTNEGDKPENVHVKINYVPFMTFNNEKELNQLRSAINSHNEEAESEEGSLKGIESLISKQKSRKGISPENEEENKEENKEENEDVTEDIIPVTYVEAKKASKKLGKVFNKLSKKNLSKIKKILSKFQEASEEEKEKYEEIIYDLGLTKKNLNNLSSVTIPFSSSEEAKGKKVSLNAFNTKVGSDVSSDSLNPKAFEDLKDLQLYMFVIEGEEDKEVTEEGSNSKDYFLHSLSLKENLDYLDSLFIQIIEESATNTSYFDVDGESTLKDEKIKTYAQFKNLKLKVLGRKSANKLILKKANTSNIKKTNKLIKKKAKAMKRYTDDGDLYKELLSEELFEKYKADDSKTFSGKKVDLVNIDNDIIKLFSDSATGIVKSVKDYYENLFSKFQPPQVPKYSPNDSQDERDEKDYKYNQALNRSEDSRNNKGWFYQDQYMKSFNEHYKYFEWENNTSSLLAQSAWKYMTQEKESAGETLDYDVWAREHRDIIEYQYYEEVKKIHKKFIETACPIIAYEIFLSSLETRYFLRMVPKGKIRKLISGALTAGVLASDGLTGGGLTLMKLIASNTLTKVSMFQVKPESIQATKVLLTPYFTSDKDYVDKIKLNHHLRREIAIAYRTIMFYSSEKKEQSDDKNPTKDPYATNFFDKKTAIYSILGATMGVSSLTQDGIFDYMFNNNGTDFFDGGTLHFFKSKLALNAMWASLGVGTVGAVVGGIAARYAVNYLKRQAQGLKITGALDPELKNFVKSIIEVVCEIKGIDHSFATNLYESPEKKIEDFRGQYSDVEEVFKRNKTLWHQKGTLAKLGWGEKEKYENNSNKVKSLKNASRKVLCGESGDEGIFKKLFGISVKWPADLSHNKTVEKNTENEKITKQLEKMFDKTRIKKTSYDHRHRGVNIGQAFFAYMENLQTKYGKDYVGQLTNSCKKNKTVKKGINKILNEDTTNIIKIQKINKILNDNSEPEIFTEALASVGVGDPDSKEEIIAFEAEVSFQKVYNLNLIKEILAKSSLTCKQILSDELAFKKAVGYSGSTNDLAFITTLIDNKDKAVENAKSKLNNIIEDIDNYLKKSDKPKEDLVQKGGHYTNFGSDPNDGLFTKQIHVCEDEKDFKKYNKKLGGNNVYQNERETFSYFTLLIESMKLCNTGNTDVDMASNLLITLGISRALSNSQVIDRIRYVQFRLSMDFPDDIDDKTLNFEKFLKIYSPKIKVNENLIFKDGIRSLIEG